MAGRLRKRPGAPAERGVYDISGSLDGVTPGRRVVKHLEVTRLDGDGTTGLAPLLAFGDLRRLMLVDVRNIDLGVLVDLDLEVLHLQGASRIDLGAWSPREGLWRLDLLDLDDDCAMPNRLALPSSLRFLGIGALGPGGSPRQVQAVLEAIDWSTLGDLTSLFLRVDPRHPPAEVDLGFLRHLGELRALEVVRVHDAGRGPSPLEPPFDGLSRKLGQGELGRIIIEACDPAPVKEQLQRYLGVPVDPTQGPAVDQRRPYRPPRPPFEIQPPTPATGLWSAYGSLADAAGSRATRPSQQHCATPVAGCAAPTPRCCSDWSSTAKARAPRSWPGHVRTSRRR